MKMKVKEITKLKEHEVFLVEGMPKEVMINTMLSLAINLIRMSKGELSRDDLPDDPFKLIAEVSAMVTLHMLIGRVGEDPDETVDKSKQH